jgi:hypothetical protein
MAPTFLPCVRRLADDGLLLPSACWTGPEFPFCWHGPEAVGYTSVFFAAGAFTDIVYFTRYHFLVVGYAMTKPGLWCPT